MESIDNGVKLKIIRKYFTRFQSKISEMGSENV